tara:strand:+ start:1939 stop:2112 length:174 start_codon:yes stop_codon:yes gene_type:complete
MAVKTKPSTSTKVLKPKASALTGRELKAVVARCATAGKANPALKAYIAAGKSQLKAG